MVDIKGAKEAGGFEGFGDVVVGAFFDGLDGAVDAGVAGDHDDAGGGCGGADVAEEVEAVAIGKGKVQQDIVRLKVRKEGAGLASVGGAVGGETGGGDDGGADLPHAFIVVDDEHLGPGGLARWFRQGGRCLEAFSGT